MQTLKRCAYALASYDEKTQEHDTYIEKKASLEECCNNIEKHIKQHSPCSDFIAVNALYSGEKNISLCCYKNTLFIGFQDKETKQISLNDRSNAFVTMSNDAPYKLQERMINALADAEKGRPNVMSQQLKGMWEPLLPTLDKIIEFEKEFSKLPAYAKESLERRGAKEARVEKILSNAPGHIAAKKEKQHVADEKKEPELCNTPLEKRFSEAKEESQKINAGNHEKIMERTKELGD